jgi:hypothetical protein
MTPIPTSGANMTDSIYNNYMAQGYAVCALWSSLDWDSEDGAMHLDTEYTVSDIDAAALTRMVEDCEAFARDNADDLDTFYRLACVDESQAGHSFWLSRNGHGAGFFDWTHPAELGDACRRLQDAARVYGTVDLYAQGGKVYD